MIREAQYSDLPYFYKAAKEFIDLTPFSLDVESYLNNIIQLMESESAGIFTNGSAHCAVILIPSLYDSNETIARVISTWGAGGLKCFDAAVKWAKENSADILIADSYVEPRMESFYKRFGMVQTDKVYLRKI